MQPIIDIAVGNPPFNQPDGDFSKTATIWEDFVELALNNTTTVAMIVPFSLGRSHKFDKLRNRINSSGLVDYKFLSQDDFPSVRVNTVYFICDKRADPHKQPVWHSSSILDTIITKIEARVGSEYYNHPSLHIKFKSVVESSTDGVVATRLNSLGYQTIPGRVDTQVDTIRVFTSYLCNDSHGAHLRIVDIAKPGVGLPIGYRSIVVEDYTIAENLANYLRTDFCVAIHNLTKTTRGVSGAQTRFIPQLDYSRSWTDKDLETYFDLTPHEVEFIHNNRFPKES